MKKFTIVVDTNAILNTKHESFKYFDTKRNLYDLALFIKSRSLKGVEILIPKLVYEDIKYHQNFRYEQGLKKLYSSFSPYAEILGFKLETPQLNYLDKLESLRKAFFNKYEIKILETPKIDLTNKLLERVINRKKPFYKKENDKDAGFKDAVIWESILFYAMSNPDHNVVFWTADSDFAAPYLIDEFKAFSKSELYIMESSPEIEALLDKEYKLEEQLSEFIAALNTENFFAPLLMLLSKKYNVIKFGGTSWNISQSFINEIVNISYEREKSIYELVVSINVQHETPYTGYGMMDSKYLPYEYEDIDLPVRVEVKFKNSAIQIIDASAIGDHLGLR